MVGDIDADWWNLSAGGMGRMGVAYLERVVDDFVGPDIARVD